jgi:hypothetical protein
MHLRADLLVSLAELMAYAWNGQVYDCETLWYILDMFSAKDSSLTGIDGPCRIVPKPGLPLQILYSLNRVLYLAISFLNRNIDSSRELYSKNERAKDRAKEEEQRVDGAEDRRAA